MQRFLLFKAKSILKINYGLKRGEELEASQKLLRCFSGNRGREMVWQLREGWGGGEGSSEGFLKDGRHCNQFVRRWEWCCRKGRGHTAGTSIFSLPHVRATASPRVSSTDLADAHTRKSPQFYTATSTVLLQLLAYSLLSCLLTEPLSHLWGLSLSGEEAMAVLTGRISPGQGMLKRSWQKPSFLSLEVLRKETLIL